MGKFLRAGKELDRYLDLVLLGKTPEQVAAKLGWSVGKVKAFFRPAFYPDAPGTRAPYLVTGKRINRSGRKMTQIELKIVDHHAKAGVPPAHTATILQRKPSEICPDYHGRIKFHHLRCLAPVTDLLLANHYLWHVDGRQIIEDKEYDAALAEEGEPFEDAVKKIRADGGRLGDYPPHIRSLAYYLLYKFMEVTGEWNEKIIPYGWTKEKHWKRKTS